MRLLPALSLVVITACASSGSSSTSTSATRPTQDVRIEGAGTLTTVASGPATSTSTLPYAIDQVWRVLPAVYDSLGIPVTTVDAATHTVGNDGLKVRFRLGKVALSRYLDCGNTQIGASADSYEVFLVVRTHLRPGEGTSTAAETALEASARSVQFAQSATRCSSKNALEPKVGELVGKLLAAATPQR